MRLTAVPIPDGDPWLRRPASANLTSVALPKVNRAFGAAD
jgi:hypothetical protein